MAETRKFAAYLILCIVVFSPLSAEAQYETGVDWVLSTTSAEWSPRAKHSAASYDGKLWVMGGDRNLNDVWSSSNGTYWELATASAGWEGRDDHASVVFQDRMWVIGGNDSRQSIRYNDVWSSTDGISWDQLTNNAPWDAREGHGCVVHNGKVWVFGGYRGSSGNGYVNDVWWTANGIDWSSATSDAEWSPRADMACTVFDEKIWLLGGNAGQPHLDVVVSYNDVWSSEDGITWKEVTESANWSERRFHSVLPFEDKLWLFGGGYGYYFVPLESMTDEIWASEDGNAWNLISDSPGWEARGEHASVVHDRKLWVLGGVGKESGLLNDVWHSPPTTSPADLNGDGVMNFEDLVEFLLEWQKH
jgi:hypothetical protein